MKYRRDNIRQRQEYERLFIPQQAGQNVPPLPTDPKQALEKALDIRKFEIENYWKRATYFWAFIAAAFAGYFALYSAEKLEYVEKHEALLVLTCIGLIFSFAWFLANKGSKFWQENWEKHVDMLEDFVYGPLYKTTLDNRTFGPFHVTLPFQYSVSKINQVLSAFIFLVWVFLAFQEISYLFHWQECYSWVNEAIIGAITIVAFFYLLFGTRGGTSNRDFFFQKRNVID